MSFEEKDISYFNPLYSMKNTRYKGSLTYPLPLYNNFYYKEAPYLFIYWSYKKKLLLFCLHCDDQDYSISISILDFYLKIPQESVTRFLSLKFEGECIILTIENVLFETFRLDEESLKFFFFMNDRLEDQRLNYSDKKDLPVKLKLADITRRFSYLTNSIEKDFQELQSILPKDILKIIFEYLSEQVEMTYDDYRKEVEDEDYNFDDAYVEE